MTHKKDYVEGLLKDYVTSVREAIALELFVHQLDETNNLWFL